MQRHREKELLFIGEVEEFKPLPGEARAHNDTRKGSQVMGTLLYVACKVLAFSSDCRRVDQFEEASLPGTATLRD
eukprot:3144300-Rhodomonas_salina.1